MKPPVPHAPKPVKPIGKAPPPLGLYSATAAPVAAAAPSPATAPSPSSAPSNSIAPSTLALVHPRADLAPPAAAPNSPTTAPVQPIVAVHVAPSPADDLAWLAVSATTGGLAPAKAVDSAIYPAGTASQSGSQQVVPSPVAPHPAARPGVAPHPAAPHPAAPSTSAPAHWGVAAGADLRLPWIPPVAGMEFVGAGEERDALSGVAAFWVSACVPAIAGVCACVPSAGLWEDCLDAADQLALLLVPMFAAPVRGGVAAMW
ncbi:unnamed protein product [Closterium sp. Naga37s-1]|nr:unnamed protein product [Closterium sp. Naga37s-1]